MGLFRKKKKLAEGGVINLTSGYRDPKKNLLISNHSHDYDRITRALFLGDKAEFVIEGRTEAQLIAELKENPDLFELVEKTLHEYDCPPLEKPEKEHIIL